MEVFEPEASGFVPALVTSYDRCSDTHTLLSDDLGVQERPLADLTLRLLEPCEPTLEASPLCQQHTEFHRPWMPQSNPVASDWGSSSALNAIGTHLTFPEQRQTPSLSFPVQGGLQPQSACEDALLHSAQINGALPDACLLPETAHRIHLQSSSSAGDLCIDPPVLWAAKDEPTDISFGYTSADQHLAAGVSNVDYICQYQSGEPLGDDLDLERLWADEL